MYLSGKPRVGLERRAGKGYTGEEGSGRYGVVR